MPIRLAGPSALWKRGRRASGPPDVKLASCRKVVLTTFRGHRARGFPRRHGSQDVRAGQWWGRRTGGSDWARPDRPRISSIFSGFRWAGLVVRAHGYSVARAQIAFQPARLNS
jgi:hypothetical protein